jgi:arsenate reductase
LFRENNVDYDKVNYFVDALTEEKLRGLLKKLDMRPFEVLRKGEAVFKERGITAETPDADVISLIAENPNLLQRPIVEVGNKAVLARPIEKALELIK